jgi:hypothetical protein
VEMRIKLAVGSVGLLYIALLLPGVLSAQTDCEAGNGPVDFTPPKTMTVEQVIEKFGAAEAKVKEARQHYTFTQDVSIHPVNSATASGQYHEVATVSYDQKGRRLENVTLADENTLRGLALTAEDMDDIRIFMPLVLTTEDLPQYNLIYGGKQLVDELDTYMFHVEPKKEDKRYFEGRIWVDGRDFQIVKVCGKSGPQKKQVKRNQPADLRPTFVTYRQLVDGLWFPAYTRSDDTLQFRTGAVHLREVVKWTNYKKVEGGVAAKP